MRKTNYTVALVPYICQKHPKKPKITTAPKQMQMKMEIADVKHVVLIISIKEDPMTKSLDKYIINSHIK